MKVETVERGVLDGLTHRYNDREKREGTLVYGLARPKEMLTRAAAWYSQGCVLKIWWRV